MSIIQKLIPKQIMIPYIGAFWELYVNVAAMFGTISFFLTTLVAYNTSEKLRLTFPSYWLFLLSCVFVGYAGMVFYFVCVLPSKTKFGNDQAFLPGRNQLYDKVCDIEKKLDELNDKK